MADKDVLQHLLEIEKQAAALVEDAQAEADKRLKEAEEQNRLSYDNTYQRTALELETAYQKKLELVKAEYNKSLDAYRLNLGGIPRNNSAFSAIVFSLLTEGITGKK